MLLQEKVGALNLLTLETFIAFMVLGLTLLSFPLLSFHFHSVKLHGFTSFWLVLPRTPVLKLIMMKKVFLLC